MRACCYQHGIAASGYLKCLRQTARQLNTAAVTIRAAIFFDESDYSAARRFFQIPIGHWLLK